MSLIDDIRSGSNEAIKQLYQENAQDIYDFAKGITGNHDTAMQATKSTLSKLVQQIQNGNEPTNIHSEALKLAYDEACKIAMPSVQNIRSPYDTDDEPEVEQSSAREKRQSEPTAREKRQSVSRRKEQYIDDDYEDEEVYEPVQRRQTRGNRRDNDQSSRQAQSGRSRQDYYDDYDDYDDYDRYEDDYDDYNEKRGRGAGFYICLIINIILVLLLIWFLIGLLINLGVLPDTIDLGYTWFDNTIYPLF